MYLSPAGMSGQRPAWAAVNKAAETPVCRLEWEREISAPSLDVKGCDGRAAGESTFGSSETARGLPPPLGRGQSIPTTHVLAGAWRQGPRPRPSSRPCGGVACGFDPCVPEGVGRTRLFMASLPAL